MFRLTCLLVFLGLFASCRPLLSGTVKSSLANKGVSIGIKDQLAGSWSGSCTQGLTATSWEKRELQFFQGGGVLGVYSFKSADCAQNSMTHKYIYTYPYTVLTDTLMQRSCHSVVRTVYDPDIATTLGATPNREENVSSTIGSIFPGQVCSSEPIDCSYLVTDGDPKRLQTCQMQASGNAQDSRDYARDKEYCCQDKSNLENYFPSPVPCLQIPANCQLAADGTSCTQADYCTFSGSTCTPNGITPAQEAASCPFDL